MQCVLGVFMTGGSRVVYTNQFLLSGSVDAWSWVQICHICAHARPTHTIFDEGLCHCLDQSYCGVPSKCYETPYTTCSWGPRVSRAFSCNIPLRYVDPLSITVLGLMEHVLLGHEEMTIEEIMLGKGDYYPGLVPLVYAYLGHIGCDADTMDTVDQARLLTSI